jgi:hypothetical protein
VGVANGVLPSPASPRLTVRRPLPRDFQHLFEGDGNIWYGIAVRQAGSAIGNVQIANQSDNNLTIMSGINGLAGASGVATGGGGGGRQN